MTPRQILLVQRSFERLKPMAAEAGLLFYDRLFTVDPSLRRMFRGAVDEQARKLMQVLGVAVGALERIEQLVPVLEQMGGKHAAYGVRDEHYETVAACLLWTLATGLGDDFDDEMREAWAAAYDLLAGAMKRGAMACEGIEVGSRS
jgi:hemoglobin-like flavoprotein